MTTNYQLSLRAATWVDVNTLVSQDNLPDLLPDDLAITNSSLRNLFTTRIGERGKLFQPEYGSEWLTYLQEPLDETTAAKMQITMLQAVARWEPRITLDFATSFIRPDYDLPGYQVRISGINNLTKQAFTMEFEQLLT